jgi:hypothetical protein
LIPFISEALVLAFAADDALPASVINCKEFVGSTPSTQDVSTLGTNYSVPTPASPQDVSPTRAV